MDCHCTGCLYVSRACEVWSLCWVVRILATCFNTYPLPLVCSLLLKRNYVVDRPPHWKCDSCKSWQVASESKTDTGEAAAQLSTFESTFNERFARTGLSGTLTLCSLVHHYMITKDMHSSREGCSTLCFLVVWIGVACLLTRWGLLPGLLVQCWGRQPANRLSRMPRSAAVRPRWGSDHDPVEFRTGSQTCS